MEIPCYLAMTAAEFYQNPLFSGNIAWMACHFSPYGRGLSNLPRALPAGSILMVDDITPIHGHDPALIRAQLEQAAQQLALAGIFLDLQRPESEETCELAFALSQGLPCPVAASSLYAHCTTGPVVLPPVPPSAPLQDHISPWTGRELWLELGRETESIFLTQAGAETALLPELPPETGFSDDALHCHYLCRPRENAMEFLLWRTQEDQMCLLRQAQAAGIALTLDFYQDRHQK